MVLADALVHEPQLLLPGEQSTGLDAAIARQVEDIPKVRVKAGATIIRATDILDVAERMARRIGIIRSGKMIAAWRRRGTGG